VQHRQVPNITILSKDLNPIVRNVLLILALAIVLGVLVLFRPRQQPAAEDLAADMEAQRAAVADDEADTEQVRMARQAMNPAAQDLDNAGPSTMMYNNPRHSTPDNTPVAPALPIPVVTPAPRIRTTRQPIHGRPFGFTLDPAGIVPA
jgi:hypothetical protein